MFPLLKLKSFKNILIFIFVLYGCEYSTNQKDDGDAVFAPIVIDFTKVKETDRQIKLSQFADSISYIRFPGDPLIGDINYTRQDNRRHDLYRL